MIILVSFISQVNNELCDRKIIYGTEKLVEKLDNFARMTCLLLLVSRGSYCWNLKHKSRLTLCALVILCTKHPVAWTFLMCNKISLQL
jgi:hypothetical protein